MSRTTRAFAIYFLGLATVVLAFRWVYAQPKDAGLPRPLRWVLERINGPAAAALTTDHHLARTYPARLAQRPRVNGLVGLKSPLADSNNYRIEVIDLDSTRRFFLTLADIKRLAKTEITYDFKCIEGWDQVTNWGGARFATFADRYHLGRHPDGKPARWIALETPDGAYYVGIDWESAVHPQTLLCYESQQAPLRPNDGAPLRLIIPVKYGIKHLKRIGRIRFTDRRPRDYWYERGYDYHAGL